MPVDMDLINNIHRVESDISETQSKIKTIRQERKEAIEEIPEYAGVLQLAEQLKAARESLKDVIQEDPSLAATDNELDELKFKLKDLVEILSHHLVVYFQDTGREVVTDSFGDTRQIDFKAKLGAEALDQEKLPFEQLEEDNNVQIEIAETRDGKTTIIKEGKK